MSLRLQQPQRNVFHSPMRLILLVIAIFSLVASTAAAAKKTKAYTDDSTPTERLLRLCVTSGSGVIPRSGRRYKQLQLLKAASGEASLLLSNSPQNQAACWILFRDGGGKRTNKRKLLQRYALATLHYATTKSDTKPWDWNMANDASEQVRARRGDWMSTKLHECQWYGVQCSRRTVVGLSLGFLSLDGLLPRELSLLTELKELDVHGCDLQGVVPHKMMASLGKLEYLRLHMNGFFGAIHREIAGMSSLKQLVLFGNYIAGTIPTELTQLSKLEVIDLYANQLSGTIPSQLATLKKLKSLDVHDNNLVGTMPKEICALKLDELVADCLGPNPEVRCDCCTRCCKGLPEMKCVDVATGVVVK
ncbi:hypothetical protein MPSEU_000397500 [Mayamaea pseudoterrestris]|nr:hypothetical protein MPSEU_000397500 [Mayamaea pseudoterrestris]